MSETAGLLLVAVRYSTGEPVKCCLSQLYATAGLLLTRRGFFLAISRAMEHSHRAVGIDSNVQGLVHQEVVPRALADNPEIVYERFIRLAILERILKTLLRNAGRLVSAT